MFLKPDRTYNANGLMVKEFLLTNHNPYNIAMPVIKLPARIRGITIHNTDWISVSASTTPAEQYTRATYNGNMNDVRVHFYVDNVCAWQNLPLTLSGFHAADGNGPGNTQTIAIECIMRNSSDAVSLKSEDNCAKLAAYLLNKYGLTVENGLYSHSDWYSGKTCPVYILPHWDKFKAKVQKELDKLNTKDDSPLYRVRKSWEDKESQTGAYKELDNAKKACGEGYKVFDEDGKIVYEPAKTSTDIDIDKETKPSTEVKPSTETKPSPEVKPSPEIKPSVAPPLDKIDVRYQVFTSKWWDEICNYNNENSMGYAGVEKQAIRGVAIKTSKGGVRYRVHTKNGGWLSWITQSNIKDWSKGCAGTRSREIDAIQIELIDLPDYNVKYRVSTLGNTNYLPWVENYNNIDDNGYAGIFGLPIDKLQIEIVKK